MNIKLPQLAAALFCRRAEAIDGMASITDVFNEVTIRPDGSTEPMDLFFAVLPGVIGNPVDVEVRQVMPSGQSAVIHHERHYPPGSYGLSQMIVRNPVASAEAGLHHYQFFLDGDLVLDFPIAFARSHETSQF
jgi:hypothetical protein